MPHDLPVVSVVMPVFNAGCEILDGLEAVSAVSYPALEILVIDDGSKDNTRQYIEQYLSKEPRAQAILLDRNVGPAAARNSGLARASGKYVWFVDWDDNWQSSILDVLVSAAESQNAKMAMCTATWRSPEGVDYAVTDGGVKFQETISGQQAMDYVLRGKIKGYLWNKVFRRDALPLDVFPNMRTQEDLCAIVSLLPIFDRVVLVPETLYHHVQRAGSLTNSPDPDLDALRIARDRVRRAAATEVSGRRRDLTIHYDVAFYYVARVNTAIRLSTHDAALNAIDDLRNHVTPRHIAVTARTSVMHAAKAVGIKLLGRRYIPIWHRVQSAKPA